MAEINNEKVLTNIDKKDHHTTVFQRIHARDDKAREYLKNAGPWSRFVARAHLAYANFMDLAHATIASPELNLIKGGTVWAIRGALIGALLLATVVVVTGPVTPAFAIGFMGVSTLGIGFMGAVKSFHDALRYHTEKDGEKLADTIAINGGAIPEKSPEPEIAKPPRITLENTPSDIPVPRLESARASELLIPAPARNVPMLSHTQDEKQRNAALKTALAQL